MHVCFRSEWLPRSSAGEELVHVHPRTPRQKTTGPWVTTQSMYESAFALWLPRRFAGAGTRSVWMNAYQLLQSCRVAMLSKSRHVVCGVVRSSAERKNVAKGAAKHAARHSIAVVNSREILPTQRSSNFVKIVVRSIRHMYAQDYPVHNRV